MKSIESQDELLSLKNDVLKKMKIIFKTKEEMWSVQLQNACSFLKFSFFFTKKTPCGLFDILTY